MVEDVDELLTLTMNSTSHTPVSPTSRPRPMADQPPLDVVSFALRVGL
jgi:hypothetical protein